MVYLCTTTPLKSRDEAFRDRQKTLERARQLLVDESTTAALLDDLAACDKTIRELTNTKKLCAREFGPAKQRGDDLAELKARMQQISSALDEVNISHTRIREQLSTLLQMTEAIDSPIAPTPISDMAVQPERDSAKIVVTEMSDAEQGDWQTYVHSHPHASLYHDVRWRSTITRVFQHRAHYLVARDDENRIRGVLPLIRQRSRLFGDFLTSLPFLNYGGALADADSIATQLMNVAAELGAQLGVRHVEFRDFVQRSDWQCRDDKVTMRLQLPEDSNVLFAALGGKLRAQIRRPERDGGTIEIGTGKAEAIKLLDDFYRVFAHNMRDLGTPVYPKRWFAAVCNDFPDQVSISVARVDGRAVGAGFMLRHRMSMEIPWASTVRHANHTGINMLMYWRHIEHAVLLGCRVFDFGRSTRHSGTYRFKEQWGAEPTPLFWHYWSRHHDALPQINPTNPRFKAAIAIWRRMPVWTTRLIGPLIVRSIP